MKTKNLLNPHGFSREQWIVTPISQKSCNAILRPNTNFPRLRGESPIAERGDMLIGVHTQRGKSFQQSRGRRRAE